MRNVKSYAITSCEQLHNREKMRGNKSMLLQGFVQPIQFSRDLNSEKKNKSQRKMF